ncbi:hypothetical protein [Belliella baltica]|uniref:hypothetical protein n=1 Tax=Belliella baltica TaxID=232259 RepID=UPI00059FCBB0|nr:hypothetical protein [Belliella baltica]
MKSNQSTLLKKVRILKTFYRAFSAASLTLTVVSWGIIWTSGNAAFAPLFWLKILTSAGIIFFLQDDMRKQFYYFQNLGFNRRQLWSWTIGFDIFLFLFGYFLILKFL